MTVKIMRGDCREIMETIEPESVDLILTDPPYGETSLRWDKWQDGWPAIARRVLKRSGSMWVFGSARMFLTHVNEFADWRFIQDVIWEKHNGSGFNADRFKRVHESAYQYVRDDSAWSDIYKCPQYSSDAVARIVRRPGGRRAAHMGEIGEHYYRSVEGGPRLMRSVVYARSEHGRADHPTQKPIGIVEPLLLYSCPPDGVVLDCFAGSGTIGIVAARHGRKSILIEADGEYAAAAEFRLANDGFDFGAAQA
ncbi:DNA-methyltransferase [Bradyrhizobium cenepequi]